MTVKLCGLCGIAYVTHAFYLQLINVSVIDGTKLKKNVQKTKQAHFSTYINMGLKEMNVVTM
jgi:hypothetical protein